jgi:hypothetical protein
MPFFTVNFLTLVMKFVDQKYFVTNPSFKIKLSNCQGEKNIWENFATFQLNI